MISIANKKYRTMTFPRIEQEDIKKRLYSGKEVSTIRCSNHYKRFKLNQICQTQWGDLIKVTKVININKPTDLEYYNQFDTKMKSDIKTYCEPGKIEDIRFILYKKG